MPQKPEQLPGSVEQGLAPELVTVKQPALSLNFWTVTLFPGL